MFEKFRHSLRQRRQNSKLTMKTVTAYVIFGAIILVFALFGITPQQMGSDLGGTAAIVNGQSISVASFRRQVESIERSTNLRLDQFPEAQRELFAKELRRRALEQMIATETLFQSANKMGVRVSDAEVRKTITSIPAFQEKDRFQRERYETYLASTGQNSAQFEREIRKELATRRIQELFLNTNKVSDTILDGIKALDQIEVSFRFASLDRNQLIAGFNPSPKEVNQFLKEKGPEIQADYDRRKVDFQTPEQVHARHILIKSGDGVSKEDAKKKALEIKKDLTVENFSALAKKHSDDPGSKSKGGELGAFQRGRMVPQFEAAAFSLEPGVISEPVETDYGYHIILVDKKEAGGVKDLKTVEQEIAKALVSKDKVDALLASLKEKITNKDIAGAKGILNQLNVKWQSVENIGLGADFISGLTASDDALKLIASQKGQTGFIPSWNEWGGKVYLIDLAKWSSKPAVQANENKETPPGERLAGEAFEKWIVSLNEKMSIERNVRLLQ